MCYSHSWKSTRPMEDNHGQGSSGKHGGVDKERNGDSVCLQTEGMKVGRKGGSEGGSSFFELSWDFLWPYGPHDWAVCSSSAKHMPPCLCGPWRFLTSEKPIFHCCRNLSAPPLATLPTDWLQFHPPEITAFHQGGPVMRLYGGSFSPQQCPTPTLFTWRYKASCPLPSAPLQCQHCNIWLLAWYWDRLSSPMWAFWALGGQEDANSAPMLTGFYSHTVVEAFGQGQQGLGSAES